MLELPDQTKLRTIHPYNSVAQLYSTLIFNHGMLMGTQEQVDTTAVPRAAINAISKILPSMMSLLAQTNATTEPDGYQIPEPELYKILVHGDQVEFNGGLADMKIQVTLNTTPAAATQPATTMPVTTKPAASEDH